MIASILKRDGRVVCYDHCKIAEAIARAWVGTYDTYEPSEDELENYRNFLWVMSELDWPAFFEYDPIFHKDILQCVKTHDMDQLLSTLYCHFDALYLKDLIDRLDESRVIAKRRMAAIREAILLYQLGYYYGTVSILVDQIGGIIKDIGGHVDEKMAGYSSKNLSLVNSRYQVSAKSEKGQLISALLEAREKDRLLWEYDYAIGYFRMKFFRDTLSEEELDENANRHLICHGNQCNYGTQDHALKVILCLDTLEYISSVLSDYETELNVG